MKTYFSICLEREMAVANLIAAEVARRAGLSQGAVSKLLSGDSAPRKSTLEALQPLFTGEAFARICASAGQDLMPPTCRVREGDGPPEDVETVLDHLRTLATTDEQTQDFLRGLAQWIPGGGKKKP